MEKMMHVGHMLKSFLDDRFFKRTEVAKQLGVPSTAIYSYEKRSSTQVFNLWKICHALKYNFFADLAAALPEDFESGLYQPSPHGRIIAQQAETIKKLQWENELMKELLAKK